MSFTHSAEVHIMSVDTAMHSAPLAQNALRWTAHGQAGPVRSRAKHALQRLPEPVSSAQGHAWHSRNRA